jgi:transmembrane sensor
MPKDFDKNDNIDKLLKQMKPAYKRSKTDIWTEMEQQMEAKKPTKVIQFPFKSLLVAACLGLIALTAVLRLYTESYTAEYGKRLVVTLPDGSKGTLNSGSTLSYTPYWWSMKRSVKLTGEAFFEVRKGERFSVESTQGNTHVLGTSFNVYARNKSYTVTCHTGKVRVESSDESKSFLLNPKQSVRLNNGTWKKKEVGQLNHQNAWMHNYLNFEAMPLADVFKELERQYDVRIRFKSPEQAALVYNGYFKQTANIEATLNLICLTFNLKFKTIDKTTYEIYP